MRGSGLNFRPFTFPTIYKRHIGSNIRLFADDTSLFIFVNDPVSATTCLNSDLVKISQWACTWIVTFNP